VTLNSNNLELKISLEKFNELAIKVVAIKNTFEDENEQIQKYLKEQKNKMGELSKKFELGI
jgi:GTP cyclohydrolase II